MERITREQVESRFEMLKKAIGQHLELDYIACYGGYQISAGLGRFNPFGNTRHDAREMHNMITFALRAIKLDRGEDMNGSYWPSDAPKQSSPTQLLIPELNRAQSDTVLMVLETHFPWLGTDESVQGAEAVEVLNNMHQLLRGVA